MTSFPPQLKLIVFDLDYTLWKPEMYQLWGGGGAPFTKDPKTGDVFDRQGTPVRLMGDSRAILRKLHEEGIPIAVASKTDEPSWADECLRKIEVVPGKTMKEIITYEEIYQTNKKKHLQNLKKKTGFSFEEMIFFDNEYGNIADVSSLGKILEILKSTNLQILLIGVISIHTPQGMTFKHLENGIEEFSKRFLQN